IPSIRFAGARFIGAGENGIIDPGETIELTVQLLNFLAPATNINVTLSSKTPKVSVTSAQAAIPSLNTNDTTSVVFQFQIQSQLDDSGLLTFFIDLAAGDYTDRDIFDINPNPPQVLSHNTGVLQTTITSKGTIGYLTNASDSNGVGFVLNNFNYLFEGGLMIATSSSSVSNTVRGVTFDQDDDFRPASGSFLRLTSPGQVADQEGRVVMVDSLSDDPIGARITQETFTYANEPFDQFVIFKYTIHNAGSQALSGLLVGLFFDWDINADALDFARFDANRSMGTVQNFASSPNRLVATKVLSNKGMTGYHAVDNRNEIDLPVSDPSQNGFTDFEKWRFMADGIQVTSRSGIDISTIAASGPFALGTTDSAVVAFAVIAAESQADLDRSADAAQYLWENGLSSEIKQIKPNITTAVLQNPAASKYADVVVVSDRSLESAPAVDLSVDGSSTSVSMQRLTGTTTLYKGAIEFTSAGAYTITTRASAVLTSVDSTQIRTYQVALAKPGALTKLSVNSGQAILSLGKNAVSAETYIIGNFEERKDEAIYTFGPAKKLNEPIEITLFYDTQKYLEPGKLFVYHQNGEQWQALPTQVNAESGKLTANTEKLGRFKMVYDGLYAGDNTVPTEYALKQNYPNPFNPSTTIEYDMPAAGEVVLTIYNQLGQVIKKLVHGQQEAGRYRVTWDARNDDGRKVSSGLYFYRIK
ncbi:MAG: FlgD immunoglobulin-like domain containing protein, partial [bacterium]